jgi:hypothetical protein
MIRNVVVSYTVKPEALEEHVRLIEAVFAQLRAEQRTDVEYKVLQLDDGVSFRHISTSDTADGSNPLPQLSAFQEFGRDLGSRVATPPQTAPGVLIGSYHPTSPITPES